MPAPMRYLRFQPAAGLGRYVEHIWMVESPGAAEPVREVLIPNGRPTLVACIGSPGLRHDPLTGYSCPQASVLFGITTRPYVLEQSGPSSHLGIQLRPWAVRCLVEDRPLVDAFLPLGEWLGESAASTLRRRLEQRPFGAERARYACAFIRTKLSVIPDQPLTRLERIVSAAENSNGQVTRAELAELVGVSPATLYRLCMTYLGVSPKQLCEITRYYQFVGSLLAESGGTPTALLAAMHGYYDQAHAARHFRRFTGTTATSFKQVHNGIARLMHSPAID